ncbi:MAG: transglycosylase SLT domain-containing protein [Gemmatimonadales bacterium]
MRRLVVLLAVLAARLPAQASLAAADSALIAGEPWRATRILTPVLAQPRTRTPEAVLLAARAAAAWEGWPTVQQLLEHETWLDIRFDRLGRRLLAESDLAQFRNPEAVVEARAALVGGARRDRDEQARRLVLLARAYDRIDLLDSAAATYRAARPLLPDLADWIALRTAAVTRDSTERAALYATVVLPAAVPRIPWTEAIARDRLDDVEGAATRYDALGAPVAAIRVRWRGAAGDSARRALASAIAGLLRPGAPLAESRDALDLIAQIDPPFTRDERLMVARRAAAVTRPQDAADQFARAARELPLNAPDQVLYGTALGALARWPEAAQVFAAVTDPSLAGRAAYYHARALMRGGQQDAALPLLHEVVRRFPADTFAASTALHLLGDLAIDAGQTDSARGDYLALAARYPTSPMRAHAILLAALIALENGQPTVAVRELSHALETRVAAGETDASRYWLARARIAAGDTATAVASLWELASRGPDNYYAVRAAARLDTIPWRTTAAAPVVPPDSLNGVFARAARLDALGMDAEARLERDRVASEAHGAEGERVGEAFFARGFVSRASQLAQRAVAAGVPRGADLWQLLYPMPFAGTLRQTASDEQVDPLLVASVIRQESGFDAHATSRTNARGLMQVEPATGRDLAQLLGFPDFDPALLWVAPVNLVLGIHHFAAALQRYPEVERGLAAYNAGTSRVDNWSMSPLTGVMRTADQVRNPLEDVEMFVERIPFVETRDYVRAIIRNRAVYAMLYGATNKSF